LPVSDDTQRVLAPIGLQQIEQTIYEGGVSKAVYQEEIRLTRAFYTCCKGMWSNEIDAQDFLFPHISNY
jgi:cytochrome c peroxidase